MGGVARVGDLDGGVAGMDGEVIGDRDRGRSGAVDSPGGPR